MVSDESGMVMRMNTSTKVLGYALLDPLEKVVPIKLSERVKKGLMVSSIFVNFLCCECRMILMFYLGFKNMMGGAMDFVYSRQETIKQIYSNAKSDASVGRSASLADITLCFAADISGAMSSFGGEYAGKCIRISRNHWGLLCVSMQCLVVVLIFVQIVLLVQFLRKCHKANKLCTYESARYMSFVWSMYETKAYIWAARVVHFYAFVAVIYTFYIGLTAIQVDGMSFLQSQAVPLAMTVFGAGGLTSIQRPAFAEKKHAFNKVIFKRNLLDMFSQTVDGFGLQLQVALCNATMGDIDGLKDMVDFEAMDMEKFGQREADSLIRDLSHKRTYPASGTSTDGTSKVTVDQSTSESNVTNDVIPTRQNPMDADVATSEVA